MKLDNKKPKYKRNKNRWVMMWKCTMLDAVSAQYNQF